MAADFVIAKGIVVIETKVDGDRIQRTAVAAGEKAGDATGRSFFRRFSKKFDDESGKDRNLFSRTIRKMFTRDPDLMRSLLHPVENFFSRPVWASVASTFIPALAGILTAMLSSAVSMAVGGGILAAGALILVGNEKLRKKISKQRQTDVRTDLTMELKNMRLALAERLQGMQRAGATSKEIAAVRLAGEEAITQKQIEGQKKLTAAALDTSTDMTRMFQNTGLKIMEILVKAASPLIGPFRRGAKMLVGIFEKLEPTMERMFAASAPILPLLLETFEQMALILFPALVDMMPAFTAFFQVLADHAPDLAKAMVTMLEAMSDKEAVTAFGIILTGIAGTFVFLAQVIAIFNRALILSARVWEAEIHFFRKIPGWISAAWGNMVQWFHTGLDAVTGFFSRVGDKIGEVVDAIAGWFEVMKERAGKTVDATAKVFRELPGKIVAWLKSLPGALADSLEAAMEGAILIVGYGLGTIVEFFVRLPGRVIGSVDKLWEMVVKAVSVGITKTVSFFATLPARISSWIEKTWQSVLDTTTTWFINIVGFIALLPGRIEKWIVKTWKTTLDTTKSWFKTIVDFIKGLPDRAATALVNLAIRINKRFTESWNGAKKTTTSKILDIAKAVLGVPVLLWQKLIQLKNKLVNRFAEGWSAATGTQKAKVVAIINHILGIPGRAFNALRNLASQLKSRAASAWQSFRDETARKVTSFITFVQGIPGRVVRGLGAIGSKLKESGRQLIQGLLVGVQNRIREIGGLGSWFKTNLVDPIVRAVKNFFHIKSPSKVFEGIGGNLVAGLWKGVSKSDPAKVITRIFGSMPKALVKMVELGLVNISSLPKKVLESMFGIFEHLLGGGSGGGGSASGLVGFAAAAWGALQNAFHLAMGGWRAHGSVPGSDHPKGKAIDIMTSNPTLHKMIIAFFKQLPGAKYWISMRQIALARTGWIPHAYHGPNPHTDHVHASFYRQGGRLPEDVLGYGSRGLYQFHKGEDVIRRNQSSTGGQGDVHHYHFMPGSVVLDASSVHDMAEVVRLIKGLQTSARSAGVVPRVA